MGGDADNYLGFPDGVGGRALLDRGRKQARLFFSALILREDEVHSIRRHEPDAFVEGQAEGVSGSSGAARDRAHPFIARDPGRQTCWARASSFAGLRWLFRVQERRIAVIGSREDAVQYALGMLAFSSLVCLSTNGEPPAWSARSQALIEEVGIPVRCEPVVELCIRRGACIVCAPVRRAIPDRSAVRDKRRRVSPRFLLSHSARVKTTMASCWWMQT